jgi:hypothetical protein
MLVSAYALCQLIAGPRWDSCPIVLAGDRFCLVSQIGTFIGFLMLAFAHSLWLVFLARIIDGLTAGNLTVAQAYISDVTEPQNRAKAFGLIGAAFQPWISLGPALSGFLAIRQSISDFGGRGAVVYQHLLHLFSTADGAIHPKPKDEKSADGRQSSTRSKMATSRHCCGNSSPLLSPLRCLSPASRSLRSAGSLTTPRRLEPRRLDMSSRSLDSSESLSRAAWDGW